MSLKFDAVCLGGGVAGEAIAEGLRDSGLTLAVVERELVGGECPYWGCVPSKTLLRSGETLSEADRARLLAASRVERTVDSTAVITPIPGLDTVDYWTNRQAAIPTELPASLAILGAGAIGVELGQAFARLGSMVTLIEAGTTFLGFEEPEAGAALRPHLERDGIAVMIGDPCVAVERQSDPSSTVARVLLHLKSGAVVRADRLLVATGRRANAEAWRDAGLAQRERGWLKVDPLTLEAHPGVFGAGDVTGLGGFTHLTHYHGEVIARRLRGIDAVADHSAVPRVPYTDPEVASVGVSEAGHPTSRRNRGRARAGDQAAHAARNTRRRHSSISGIQPCARGKSPRARREDGVAQCSTSLMQLVLTHGGHDEQHTNDH